MSSVLYDSPGPHARVRNRAVSVGFVAVLLLGAWWLWDELDSNGQLDWALWKPFTQSEMWTTYLLPGLGVTVKAAALSLVIALPLGAVFGTARLSDHLWVRVPATVVVEFFRAVPVLLMMLFANEAYAKWSNVTADDRALYATVTGLVLYNSSVLAEIMRAGILALPKGQAEAAQAIGLRKGQTMRSILLPQAVTTMLPAIVSQLVIIVKDTALGGAMIGLSELLIASKTASANYANTVPNFIVTALIYMCMNLLLSGFASWLERRLRRSKGATGSTPGPEGLQGPAEPAIVGPSDAGQKAAGYQGI